MGEFDGRRAQKPLGSFARPLWPKLKTNTSAVILRNFNSHPRFIPNFNQALVEAIIFILSLQFSNWSGLSPLVIQVITGRCAGGHPCDSDNRSLFRVQGLPLWAPLSQRRNSPLFEWTCRPPTPFYPLTKHTAFLRPAHMYTRRLKRNVDPIIWELQRRYAGEVTSSTSHLGNRGMPRPRIHVDPNIAGIHDPSTANTGLDHSWMTWLGVVGGAKWRNSYAMDGMDGGAREQTVAEVRWAAIPRLTCYNGPPSLFLDSSWFLGIDSRKHCQLAVLVAV